jgi:predicted AAA+ superfamily ATPase
VSLSDRFGLWLGFHKCSQDEYLAMVFGYLDHFGIAAEAGRSAGGGARMGDDARLALGAHAWQFIQDWAGTTGQAAGVSKSVGLHHRVIPGI